MGEMKIKIRSTFAIFIVASLIVLLYYNQYYSKAYSYHGKIQVVIFIFIIALVSTFYIVYETYRIMHSEMVERMEMLAASKNDLQTTYNSIFMLLIEVGLDGVITNANEAVSKALQKKKSQIVGKPLETALEISDDAMCALKQAVNDTFREGLSAKEEIESKGQTFEVFIFPLHDSPDQQKKVLVILNDVTQVRMIYRQMLQDNKMTAVGQLAAGVAHEIRNPLGLIRNYCYLLKKQPEDMALHEKAIPMIEDAVERSSLIIDNLLRFSRMSNENWSEVHLYQAIHNVISLEAHALIRKNVEINVTCCPKMKFYTILESLEMILINLIINSVDAMKGNGEIRIVCTKDKDMISIAISDMGEGIPDEIKMDIFNPFFTTKEDHSGSGLGLYIVYNEVNKLGGRIELVSQVGAGTTFTILLPNRKGEEKNGSIL